MYMLHECGVQTPAFSKLKDMQFGDCRWEEMLQKGNDKDNTPFWILKPSEILKLLIAQPCMAESLIRRPVCSDSGINHPAAASKWHNDIEFHTTYLNDKLYFVGRIYNWTLDGKHEVGILEKFQDNILVIAPPFLTLLYFLLFMEMYNNLMLYKLLIFRFCALHIPKK